MVKAKILWLKPTRLCIRFAHVDFATAEAKTKAITYSERELDDRRLLIKDGKRSTASSPSKLQNSPITYRK